MYLTFILKKFFLILKGSISRIENIKSVKLWTPHPVISRQINFGWLQRVKKCCFDSLEGFQFWFLEKFYIWKCQKFAKIQNSELLQMVKMAVFGAWKWPKLISRKFWLAEKSWNFHIVYSQILGCPGLYLQKWECI